MDRGYVFMSYSRCNSSFTEAIMLHLARVGGRTWFDVQGIVAGSDWKRTLQAGMDGCSGLVLIASCAALSSPYVRAEW